MNVDSNKFTEKYHEAPNGRFKDNWQEGIRILPFSSNASGSAFDKKCSLQGTVGEFARLIVADGAQPIKTFEESVIEPLKRHLFEKRMKTEQIEEFVKIVRDVLSVDGNLNIVDPALFKFLPLVPDDSTITDAERKKYSDGQRKMARYIQSMYPSNDSLNFNTKVDDNLFLSVVSEALTSQVFGVGGKDNGNERYMVPPYIKQSFTADIKWLFDQDDQIKAKYLGLLLHFYACYAITQTILLLSPEKSNPACMDYPEGLYFILSSEKTSLKHDAVVRGWTSKIQEKKTLERLFGKIQALDIANSILGGNIGFYPSILSALKETPFEENREILQEILRRYEHEKRELLSRRKSEHHQNVQGFRPDVMDYDDFLRQLENCCTYLQSVSYVSRFKKKVTDILGIRFLQRRRENYVLAIDNEMLTFLISLMTRGRKTKLEEMYKQFNRYGIFFNRGTRSAIEEYLVSMDLLDRKSDSGEVQYVKAVL